jgi:2-polyprenyl-6-methoxyphenol hydroxylase-like FAD-dependent oxidoreductase
MSTQFQVAIVGGGPVGVALAIELGQRGISCAIVEKRTEPHRIPKGQGLTQRSMEHFYRWGVADKLRSVRILPQGFSLSGVTAYMDLSTPYWYSPPFREVVNAYYFQESERVPQYVSESVLRTRMEELPNVDSRVGWTAQTIEQDAAGVRVGIVSQTGEREVIAAEYAVGCDGSHSTVRAQAGIERDRQDFDQLMVLAVIRSRELHEGLKRFPPRSTYRAMDPELRGYWRFFGRVDAEEGFFFHAPVPMETTRDNYDFLGLMQRAAGFKFACEFDYVGFWDMAVAIARQYRVGRIFIAGDAAHSHPPYGGYGLNNGLDDVSNLGWKLAARLNGWGSDALLQTYTEERQPVFRETAEDFILGRIRADRDFLERYDPDRDRDAFERAWEEGKTRTPTRAMTYDPHCEGSSIVFGPPGSVCSAHGTHTFEARPGHHLPSRLLSDGRNVFEALGREFTLLAFDAGEDAVARFEQASRALGVPLTAVCDSYADGREAYQARLILVRPDHYIAWTGDSAPIDAAAVMAKAAARAGTG